MILKWGTNLGAARVKGLDKTHTHGQNEATNSGLKPIGFSIHHCPLKTKKLHKINIATSKAYEDQNHTHQDHSIMLRNSASYIHNQAQLLMLEWFCKKEAMKSSNHQSILSKHVWWMQWSKEAYLVHLLFELWTTRNSVFKNALITFSSLLHLLLLQASLLLKIKNSLSIQAGWWLWKLFSGLVGFF